MIPCPRTFDGKETYIDDNGVTIYRWYRPEWRGNYTLTIRFVSSNSPQPQGIWLLYTQDFCGSLFMNGEKLKPRKKLFDHYLFSEDYFPEREFTLRVESTCGSLILSNTSQRPNSTTWGAGYFGYAMWVETIGENHYRFHCNDFDYDDDFDDLIFDIIVTMEP